MKLWSVKAFLLDEDEKRAINNYNAKGDVTGVMHVFVRKMTMIAKDLTWEKAKEIRSQYRKMGAMIFPNVVEELKVIQLS